MSSYDIIREVMVTWSTLMATSLSGMRIVGGGDVKVSLVVWANASTWMFARTEGGSARKPGLES